MWDVITQNQPWDQLREDPQLEWPTLRMAGQSVFRWAVWQMAPIAQKAIEAAGVTPDDLAAFIPHQANVRIIDAMVKQLGLPEHVPSRATSPRRATRPPRRSRSRCTGCSPTAPRRPAAWPC